MFRNIIRLAMIAAIATSALGTSVSCASKNLDRKQATALIQRAQPFTQPYSMIIRHGSDRRYLDPVSPDETRVQGEARAVENWRTSFPYRAVLMQMGLVDVRAKYVSTRMYGDREDRSTYDLEIRLTPQGEELWRQMGLQVDPDAVPLGRRKLIAVTGISGGDANTSRAAAEFTWQWELTPAGAAMVRDTPEFERLPDEVKNLFESAPSFPPSAKVKTPLSLLGTHQGVANFQKFDDGWRITSIEPATTRPLNPLD